MTKTRLAVSRPALPPTAPDDARPAPDGALGPATRAPDIDEAHAIEVPLFATILDRDRRIVWVNVVDPAVVPDPTQVIGQPIDPLVHPDHLARAITAIEATFQTGISHAFEAEAATPDAPAKTFGTRVIHLGDSGEGARVLLVTADVTARNAAAARLAASEERLAIALEASNMGLWEWHIQDDHWEVSTLYLAATGQPPDAPRLRSHADWLVHIDPSQRAHASDVLRAHLDGDQAAYELEYQVTASEDRTTWILERGKVVERAADGTPLRALGTHTDVTHRRAQEDERIALHDRLEQVQRMESLGELASGVAHDFNNLLMVILTYARFADIAARAGQSPVDEVGQITAAAERAADLVKQLMTFGKRRPHHPTSVDLVDHLKQALDLLRRTIPESVQLVFMPPDHPIVVRADPTQLDQVLVNLCVNARDALPRGGTISFQLSVTREDDVTPGLAHLSVADDGCGMDPEVARRAFEPFFTTKGPGRGSGLGLATVHGIVRQHGWAIRIDSAPGRGTTVSIDAPLTEEAQPSTPALSTKANRARPGEVILVAEDDRLVRTLAVRVLSSAGYEVLEAQDGRDAVRAVAAAPNTISLALIDAVMPGLSGPEAISQIRAIRPDLPVILASGYGQHNTAVLVDHAWPDVSLAKPYAIDDLLAKIRELLDARAQERRAFARGQRRAG